MKKPKTSRAGVQIQKLTHHTMPATVGLVKEVRNELRADIRSVEHKLESVEHKLESVRSELKGDIEGVKASVEELKSSVHRTQVLMEEQRGENRIVLDGIKNFIERQDRLETVVGELRNTVSSLSYSASR